MPVKFGSWPLIGRDSDLQLIRDALASPQIRGVMVFGQPGVGKTRLVETLCQERESAGGIVERVLATADGRDFPLAALAPLLVQSGATRDITRDPVQLLAHLQQVLRRPAGEPTPLLFVDDLPLLDALSALVISQLLEAGAVLLLSTLRAGDPLPQMYHGRWSGDGVLKVELEPLTDMDCLHLLGRAMGAPVATKAVARLHALSGGIPLHLRELVMSAAADGTLCQVDGVWQLGGGELRNPVLAQLLATRIEKLEPSAVHVLRRVAVCQPLELDDLGDEAGDALMALEEAGLIEIGQATDGEWTVRPAHPAYADLIRAQLSRLHVRRLMIEMIAVVQGRGRGARDVMRLTLWQLEATGRADPSILITAATIARQGHEFESVRRLAAAAVDSEPEPSAESLLLWGEALRELGDGAAAGAVLDRAASAGGPAEIRARVAVVRAGLACHGRNRPDVAVAILAEARDTIPEEADAMSLAGAVMLIVDEQTDRALEELARTDPQRARSPRFAGLTFLAAVGALVSSGQPQQALDTADELLPMLRRTGNLFHDGMPLMLRAAAQLETSGPSRALPDATAAMRECLNSGVDRLICYAASQLFAVQLAAGRPRNAARWAREVISVARGAEHNSFVSVGMSNLACAQAIAGDVTGARDTLGALDRENFEQHRPGGQSRTWQVSAQAWTLAAEGQQSRAIDLLEAGAAQASGRGQWSAAGSLLHDAVRMGGAKSAVVELRAVAARCASPLAARQLRQAVAVLTGDLDELTDLGQEWEAIGEHVDRR